jgi:hypothetical protein
MVDAFTDFFWWTPCHASQQIQTSK